jgi:hypothetical protein
MSRGSPTLTESKRAILSSSLTQDSVAAKAL